MRVPALRSMPLPAQLLLIGLVAAVLAAALAAGVAWQAGTGAAVVAAPPDEVCLVAPSFAYEPASGLDRFSARPLRSDARCPVCGMFPARSPRWAAQVIYRDGDVHYFDSPLSLHLFLAEVPRHASGRVRADVAVQYVTDFAGGGWIDAQGAYYVHGSSEAGPMRAGNLPAFATLAAAQAFAAARGGRVLTASQIDAAVLRRLDTRSTHRH